MPSAPVTASGTDAVSELLMRFYDVLDDGSFDVGQVVEGLESVTFLGTPTEAGVLTLRAREVLADAEDVSLLLLRMQQQAAAGGQPRVRITACLIWSPRGTWLDHEHEFDVTIDLMATGDGRWQPGAVRIDPPTPEAEPYPEDRPSDDSAGGGR